ncbi:MAG: hypothetical protein LBQ74_02815 [Prevotella sp.]|jgi:hypothetical protein|nr:hypothetical protein [Prevotella sp.]
MARLEPKPSTVKKLFALSGNKCAFENCNNNLVIGDTLIGEICHIEAAEPGGSRWNKALDDELCRDFNNLILMCPNCHTLIDSDEKKYTTDLLMSWKKRHIEKFNNKEFGISQTILDKAIQKFSSQVNINMGAGSINNYHANNINIDNRNYFDKNNSINIEGARSVNYEFKKIIDQFKQKASPPSTDVIDFRNELKERFERPIELIPTKHLRFRKNNGRIIAEVESYERENNIILNENTNDTQEILRTFLISNDKEKNEELKKLLSQKGQQRPAIITCDGFLINGNRRKMALEELYKEKNQDPQFQMMRVVILPEGVTELEVQQIENRYQLQGEGKSEYQGLNRAIKIKRNIENGFSLEAQLRDDPNYYELPPKEFERKVKEFEKKFLNPLRCADRYLETFERKGLYNTISESAGDKEGRWQAFIDYSSFYYSTLHDDTARQELNIKEDEIGLIENAIFKIIRKRNLNSREIERALGKVHAFVRGGNLKKYLANQDAKKYLVCIAKDVPDDIEEYKKQDRDGKKLSEREIDEKWGNEIKVKEGILGNLMKAYKAVNNQSERIKPIELLEDSLKKLNHENMKIEDLGVENYKLGLDLCNQIRHKAEELHKMIDTERAKYQKLKGKR